MQMKKLLSGIVVSAVIAVMLTITAQNAVAENRTLRSADTHEGDYPTVKAVEYMGGLIKERSSGRYDIKVFHSRQLGEEKDTIEMVELGALDLARTSLSPFNDLVTESRVLTLPFLFRSVEHYHNVLDGEVGQTILGAFAAHGFIGLAYYDSGARSFYTVNKPIAALEDLKGLRIRVQDSDLIASTMEALGALPMKMPFGQVDTALRTGLIDAAENNWPSYYVTGHYKAAPFYSLSRHLMVPEVLVMSKKIWDTLSADDQVMIRNAAKESSIYMRKLWAEQVAEAKEKLEKANVTITEIKDLTPFQNAVGNVYDKYADTPELKKLVEMIKNTK